MIRKSNVRNNRTKLYHKLINNKLVYNNKSLNRYKKDINQNLTNKSKEKLSKLADLKISINSIRNCELKKNATNLVFSDGSPPRRCLKYGGCSVAFLIACLQLFPIGCCCFASQGLLASTHAVKWALKNHRMFQREHCIMGFGTVNNIKARLGIIGSMCPLPTKALRHSA